MCAISIVLGNVLLNVLNLGPMRIPQKYVEIGAWATLSWVPFCLLLGARREFSRIFSCSFLPSWFRDCLVKGFGFESITLESFISAWFISMGITTVTPYLISWVYSKPK